MWRGHSCPRCLHGHEPRRGGRAGWPGLSYQGKVILESAPSSSLPILRNRAAMFTHHCAWSNAALTLSPRLVGLIRIDVFMYNNRSARPLLWIGTSRRDLRGFPRKVRRDIGQALYAAQQGETDPSAKPMRGFGGGSVLEIIAKHHGDTWRAVYTVRHPGAIYVLHAFQKKSKRGIATPKNEIDLIHQRLAEAERLHRERQN